MRQCLEATRDAFLRIALLHHPLSDLHEFDEDRIDGLLSTSGVHFLLRGHLHKTRATVQTSPDGRLTQIAAGTLYVEGGHARGFNLADVDLEACRATLHLFRYSPEGQGFWAADTQAYEKAPKGVWMLNLPETLCSGSPALCSEDPEATAARLQSTAARYRQAAAACHGRARFIGFADHRPRPNTTVDELYVPLRLTLRGQHGLPRQQFWAMKADEIRFGYHGHSRFTASVEEPKPWTTATVVERFCARPSERGAARIVVLGGPGSGKTTLCRFLSVVMAGEIRLPDVAPDPSLIPLLLPFREYTRESASLSIIEFLYRQAATELSIALPEGFLEDVLEAGQAVPLLDGLDEVGRPEDRAAMRDRVLAFCRAYPRTPFLVTSRIAGYDEAPLAADGREAFVHLELAAFEDEDLREFVRRWYAVQEPDDPVARDRGIADLSAALTTEPRITELARNPMLATLIALIHRFEAHLPGERAKLYELCVKTLLDTWPAATGRQFQEIDTGLQRVYLEKLSYAIQSGRKLDSGGVVIDRGDLVARLSGLLGEREYKDALEATRTGLVERWVAFLEEGSGLLVEQSAGHFAFFHLSFLEYLAARGWEREPDLDLPKAIAEQLNNALRYSTWGEVCLLAVGVHAEDGPFLDALFDHLVGHPNGVPFLLRALREEACFTPEQRARILAQAGAQALEQGPPFDISGITEDVIRFSVRNGGAVRSWIDETLRSQTGEALLSAAALRLPHAEQEILAILESRRDMPTAARTVVEFWPGSKVGDWAAERLEPPAALDWAEGANELLAIRGLAALGLRPDSPLAAALSLGLAARTLRLGWLVQEAHTKLAGLPRPGGHGMPGSLLVRPGDSVLPTEPRLPLEPRAGDQPVPCSDTAPASRLVRFFADSFARDFVRYFGSDSARDKYGRHFGLWFARFFPFQRTDDLPFALAKSPFFRFFSCECARGFAAEFFYNAWADVGLASLTPGESREFVEWITADIDIELGLRPRPPTSPRSIAPGRRAPAPSEPWLAKMRDPATDEQALEVLPVMATLGGEITIAVAAMAEGSVDDRKSYFSFRLQNRWLSEIWPALDDCLSTPPGPWQLAIYYALAWTQFSTTWTWPDTERWRGLFGERPPAQWLPRAHWHLCWLTYDPGLTDHIQGLDEALAEGEADTALPGYAAQFREVLGRPGGSKWAQG